MPTSDFCILRFLLFAEVYSLTFQVVQNQSLATELHEDLQTSYAEKESELKDVKAKAWKLQADLDAANAKIAGLEAEKACLGGARIAELETEVSRLEAEKKAVHSLAWKSSAELEAEKKKSAELAVLLVEESQAGLRRSQVNRFHAEQIVLLRSQLEAEKRSKAEEIQRLKDEVAATLTKALDKMFFLTDRKIPDLKSEIARLKEASQLGAEESLAWQNKFQSASAELLRLRASYEAQCADLASLQAEYAKAQAAADRWYEAGFRYGRRLSFHLKPDINWAQAEEWFADPESYHMTTPSQAEKEFMIEKRLKEKLAEAARLKQAEGQASSAAAEKPAGAEVPAPKPTGA